jgi:hypothetical protein
MAPSFYFPPVDEVADLWTACVPCTDDDEVSSVLERRALKPDVVDELGLARALPWDAHLPGWASFRGRRPRAALWTETGHRLILPVCDALGRMRSVRAWSVRATGDPKRLSPRGHRATSLLLACPNGVALLASGRFPETARPFRVVLTEGEPDFLTWATRWSDAAEDAPVVFGVISGGWGNDFAARIPDGSRVIVRTHHDCAGDGYARLVQRSLGGRCVVLRARGS